MWLNGIGIQDISRYVHLVDVIQYPPERDVQVEQRAKYHGLRYLGTTVEKRVIEVLFDVKVKDKTLRQIILDELLGTFDANGELQLQSRDGQYLNVVCTSAPAADSMRDYANTLTLEYTSYDPFWKTTDRATATRSLVAETQSELSITPAGNADQTFLEFTLENASGVTINEFNIGVNRYTFSFTSLGLAAGKTLICAYDNEGYLTLTIDGTSVMNKRTGDDDLLLNIGKTNTVAATAERAAALTLYARGLWK